MMHPDDDSYVTDGEIKALGSAEEQWHDAADSFIKANYGHLNIQQIAFITGLFNKDQGPDEFFHLASFIQDYAADLAEKAFRPYGQRGDMVVRPAHYSQFPMEPTWFIQTNGVDWCRGNALKYICRYRHKSGIEDLRKAARYIEMFAKFLLGETDWSR